MKNLKFITTLGDPSPEDKQKLVEGMLAHHAKNGHIRKTETISIFLHDENDQAVGGVIVSVLWGGMEIQALWVDESIRGQGWGKKLMEAAEQEGIKRNCTIAYTNTFSWQAPDFYQNMGYTLYGKLDNFPQGCTLSYFQKKLTPAVTINQ